MDLVRRAGVAAAIVAGALVLGACSSSDSDGATVKAGGAPGSTTAVEGAPASLSEEDCAAVGAVLLRPADLGSASDDAGEPPVEDEIAALHRIAAVVPADQRAAWANVVDVAERNAKDPDSVTIDQVDAVLATLDASVRWATGACPDLPPAWKCQLHATFHVVGQRIEPEGDTGSTGAKASPEAALASIEGADQAVELDRSDDSVLYGWRDGDGLVERIETIDHTADGWVAGAASECSSSHFGGTPTPVDGGDGTTTTAGPHPASGG